jgi:hypothetical protein
MAVALIF